MASNDTINDTSNNAIRDSRSVTMKDISIDSINNTSSGASIDTNYWCY